MRPPLAVGFRAPSANSEPTGAATLGVDSSSHAMVIQSVFSGFDAMLAGVFARRGASASDAGPTPGTFISIDVSSEGPSPSKST